MTAPEQGGSVLFGPFTDGAETTPGQAADWGVVVNEVKILATRQGLDWWALYHARQPQERLTCLTASIAGSRWHVATGSREDADMLIETMTGNGINPKFLKAARLSAVRRG